ncbi:hypothetical protein ESCAB7627_2345 [Escherichia albertii TW07627]|uniref:Uncharacterized protein n=1 Tax=Escherichia albertii (strain TW07627) TaxID=502347 RepID=A0ABC9NPE9_ESCAT|nr:hypothetical protein ESCAB7627_2345 [Escherichia albertii TW07627]
MIFDAHHRQLFLLINVLHFHRGNLCIFNFAAHKFLAGIRLSMNDPILGDAANLLI